MEAQNLAPDSPTTADFPSTDERGIPTPSPAGSDRPEPPPPAAAGDAPARERGAGFQLLEDPLTDHLIATRHRRDALEAARELTLSTLVMTRRSGLHRGRPESRRGEGDLELLSDLRRATAGVALGLETASARSLTSALRSLWRAGELTDRAERAGLLEMDEAMQLLGLGSRVEIPLVVLVRKYGTEEV